MEEEAKKLIEGYEEHAKENGIHLNPSAKAVESITQVLIKRRDEFGEFYCPCRRITGDKEADRKIICPCVYHLDEVRRDGHCLCNLYVK
jgi:ferredoxin-thioredoxin reductase catalytic subunit